MIKNFILFVIGFTFGLLLYQSVFAQTISKVQEYNVDEKGILTVLDSTPVKVFVGTKKQLEFKKKGYEKQIADLQLKIDEVNIWLQEY